MKHRFLGLFVVLLVVLFSSHSAFADSITPIGFISFDAQVNPVTQAVDLAEFDITNLTGSNSDGVTFLVATQLTLSNLNLTVTYLNGSTETFGPSYFTSDGAGDFNGKALSTSLSYPYDGFGNAVSATLTGLVNTNFVNFTDGTSSPIALSFSATDSGSGPNGLLLDQDLAVINVTETPEPSALILAGTGFVGLFLRRRKLFSESGKVVAAVAVGAVLMGSTHSSVAQSVKLTSVASPSSGASGISTVAVTGSGFPAGTIPAGNVTLSLAGACAGSGTNAPATSVVKVISTTERVQFVLPASLSSGTYFISLSGTTSTGTAFSSVSCSQVSVTGSSPTATLSSSSLTFPTTSAQTSAATQTVALSNTGSGPLNISSINLTGTGTAQFSESNNCPASLAVGADCIITAGFNPLTAGTFSAAVVVADNDSSSTQTIALGGSSTAPFISGNVYGGTQPISGATVTLWSAGASGSYGAGSTSIATTTTNPSGSFSFIYGGASLCTTGQSLYVTSVGGSSGTGINQYAALLAALPTACNSTTAGTSITINEVTTVASVTALQQFMSITPGGASPWSIGAPGANVTGMVNAFTQVGNLISLATGASGPVTAANTINSVTYTTTITPDSNKINTLADILASCVGTNGSGTCANLFTATTPTGLVSPSDTIQVAYYLATNAAGLNLPNSPGEPAYLASTYASSGSPFQPYSASPTDWAIGVSWSTSNGTAVVGTATPYSLAIDGSGNIWTAYSCGASSNSCTDSANDTHSGKAYVTEFNPQGQVQFTPVSSTTMTAGPALTSAITGSTYNLLAGEPFSLAIDTANNAWFDSYWGANPLTPATIGGVITKIAPGGASTGYVVAASAVGAMAIDGNNNIFLDDAPSYNSGNRYYLSELEYKSGAYSTFDIGLGRQTVVFSGVWADSLGYGWSAASTAAKCGSPNGTIYRATTTEMEAAATTDDVGGVTVCPVWSGAADPTGGSFYANGGLYHVAVTGASGSRTAVMASEAAGTGTTNGGLDGGAGTVVDGFSNIWVANSAGGVSEFAYTGTGFTPLSPAGTTSPVYGFGSSYLTGTNPINVATDASGNVWIGTQSLKLWYLVGIAGPTVTPISKMLSTSFIGSRPGALTLDSLSPALTYNTVASVAEPLTATLTNTGSANVNISGITIGGTNAADFTVTSKTCGSTLAIGANCTITVTFNASGAGTFTGTLNVASNAAGSPASVNLTGTTSASAGTINLNATTTPSSGLGINFGTVTAPATTTAKAVVLTNSGSTPMTLTLGTTGTGANLFPQTTNCTGSLAAGASCFVSIKFSPKVAGGYTAGLTIMNNTGTGQVAALSGNATPFTITMDTTNPSAWVIDNGAITFKWNSTTAYLNSWVLDGYSDQLVDTTTLGSGSQVEGLYSGMVGPFMNGTPTSSCTQVGATVTGSLTCAPGSGTTPYVDWAITWLDTASASNAFTFVWHYVVFPNDPGVHTYVQLIHNPSDITGGVGQIQWIFRDNQSIFTHTYEVDSALNWLGAEDIPLPPWNDPLTSDPGRNVQNAATDLHGDPYVLPSYGRWFETKYDYAGYEYLHQAHGLYGPATSGTTYGVWTVLPKLETFVGGPTKQDLWFTGNIDMIEAQSNHEINNFNMSTAAGSASNRLFGPYYIHVNTLGTAYNQAGTTIASQADMYADAISAGAALVPNYDTVDPLLAAGYVPTNGRGSVSIQMSGVSGAPHTAWAVLSDPNTNFQYTNQGMQYWADISQNGTATITGVAPGTYRLSVYVLGQWGEYRQDGIVVTANNTTTVPTATFQQENFTNVNGVASGETVFTIGTADRSSHEFLHGHNTATGNDDREYWGNWNYWQDFAANNGAVVYYATAVGSTPATNDLSKWNYTHWATFNPGLFAGVFNSSDDTTDGYSAYPGQSYAGINGYGGETAIPAYVAGLTGASGTNGASTGVPAWQVYFATPSDIANYKSGNVELSISSACAYGSYVVTLNPGTANVQRIWHYTNYSDCMIRSGLSGYTQWFVMEFPASALNQTPGGSNEITVSMSGSGAQDDAWRLELTNNTSNPTVTGWNDYTWVTGSNYPGTGTANSSGLYNNDAIPNP